MREFDDATFATVEQMAIEHGAQRSGFATFRKLVERELGSVLTDTQADLARRMLNRHTGLAVMRSRRRLGLLLLPVAIIVDIAAIVTAVALFTNFAAIPSGGGKLVAIGVVCVGFVVVGVNVVCFRALRGKGGMSSFSPKQWFDDD